MAPRTRRIVHSPEPEDSSPSQPVSESLPTNVPASVPDGHETFNLDDVHSSESTHGDDSNVAVNDPDAVPLPKTAAHDIRHFFDRTGEQTICKVCK